MRNALVIIPARYGSTRFPAKPLAQVCGHSMIERCWRIAAAAVGPKGVFVATDHQEIFKQVKSFGGQALMTTEDCRNGTERVWEALKQVPAGSSSETDVVINLQGDALLTPPWIIEALADLMEQNPAIGLGTAAVRLSPEEYELWQERKRERNASGTFVVFDKDRKALYFSKMLIPFVRKVTDGSSPVCRHIGIYAYRRKALQQYLALPPGPLEEAEGLEQLRALENGIPMHVALVDYRGRTHASIDKPEDVKLAEEIIAREGELVDWTDKI